MRSSDKGGGKEAKGPSEEVHAVMKVDRIQTAEEEGCSHRILPRFLPESNLRAFGSGWILDP